MSEKFFLKSIERQLDLFERHAKDFDAWQKWYTSGVFHAIVARLADGGHPYEAIAMLVSMNEKIQEGMMRIKENQPMRIEINAKDMPDHLKDMEP